MTQTDTVISTDDEVVENAADAAGEADHEDAPPPAAADVQPVVADPNSIGEIRKRVREQYPVLRGQVSLYITKADGLAVLTGQKPADQLAAEIKAKLGTAKRKATRKAKSSTASGSAPVAQTGTDGSGTLAGLFASYAGKRKKAGHAITAAEIASVRDLLDLMTALV